VICLSKGTLFNKVTDEVRQVSVCYQGGGGRGGEKP